MAGPVTEGSIVARLKLDSSDWDAKLDAAEEKARALGRISPTIKVTADTAAAIAELNAVREAADASGGNRSTSSSSTTTNTVRTSGQDSVAALAAAEDALRRASTEAAAANDLNSASMRSAATAAAEAAAAQDALALAQQRAAAASREQAAASQQTRSANAAVTESGHGLQAQTLLIVAGISALVATAGPVAGWAAGVAGALGGMGAAGIVSIYGINQAIKTGTDVGQAYSAGLQDLKGDLDALASTGATSMLASFQSVVGILDANMPELNAQVNQFGGMLGGAVTTSLQGVMNVIRVLNPLFVQAGGYIQDVANGFLSWTTNGGLQSFAAMAESTFPSVVQMIGSVLNGAMNLVVGLQDLGPAVLITATALGEFASFLGAIGPVLGPVAVGAAAAFGAFKLWGTLAPILAGVAEAAATATGSMTLLNVAVGLGTGPIGLIAAGIGLVVTAFIAVTAATHQATKAQTDYTEAVQQDTGVIGQNVRAAAAKALSDEGLFKTAQSLGISQSALLDATLRTGDGMNTVKARTDLARDSYQQLEDSGHRLTPAQQDLKAAVDSVTSGVNGQNGAIKSAQDAYKDQQLALDTTAASVGSVARAYGASVSAYQSAKSAADDQKSSAADATLQMQLESDAAGILKSKLDDLNGKTLSAADAQNAFDSQLANMGTHVDATGKQITFTTSNISDMSTASVALRGQLNGQVEALQNNVEAQVALTHSTAGSIPMMQTQRQQIIDNAVAHGVSRDAVTAYVDSILTIPSSVKPTHVDIDKTEAGKKLDDLMSAFAKLPTAITGTYSLDTSDAIRNVNNAIAAVKSLAAATAQAGANGVSATAGSSKKALAFATGGSVPGTGSGDTVPAMLTPGEYVVKPGPAAEYGPLLAAMNAGQGVTLPSSAGPSVQASPSAAPARSTTTTPNITVTITNKTGVTLSDLIDIRVDSAFQSQDMQLANGLQDGTF